MLFENTHPAIIDPDTWEIAQKNREQRKRPMNEKVNLVEVFRPDAVPARIAVNDGRHFRLLRHFLHVDFLIGENPEIAAVLRVQAGASVFVTAQLLGLVAAAAVYGILVSVRRAVPLHCAPAGLRSHPVHFRFAGNLINRDAGNIRYEIPGLILFFMVESSFKV